MRTHALFISRLHASWKMVGNFRLGIGVKLARNSLSIPTIDDRSQFRRASISISRKLGKSDDFISKIRLNSIVTEIAILIRSVETPNSQTDFTPPALSHIVQLCTTARPAIPRKPSQYCSVFRANIATPQPVYEKPFFGRSLTIL
jgi:hypothetical protein